MANTVAMLQVTATAEVSSIQTGGPIHRRRIQGALLADGVNCFFSALAMTLPVTTFAQNNGVRSSLHYMYSCAASCMEACNFHILICSRFSVLASWTYELQFMS